MHAKYWWTVQWWQTHPQHCQTSKNQGYSNHCFHVPSISDCIFLVYLLYSSRLFHVEVLRCHRRIILPRPKTWPSASLQLPSSGDHGDSTLSSDVWRVLVTAQNWSPVSLYSIIINILSPYSRVVNTSDSSIMTDMNEPLMLDTNIVFNCFCLISSFVPRLACASN